MAILTVENVGPIKQATLDIKKCTVFIGPQGSGKSTLAKLIAISRSNGMWPIIGLVNNQYYSKKTAIDHYSLNSYISDHSYVKFTDEFYEINNNDGFDIFLTENGEAVAKSGQKFYIDFESLKKMYEFRTDPKNAAQPSIGMITNASLYVDFMKNTIMPFTSLYIPAERTLTSLLSSALWSLVSGNINLPHSITLYGTFFEKAINSLKKLTIPFLDITFSRSDSGNTVEHSFTSSVKLEQSASGYQAIIPLLTVIENERLISQHHFIVEEPELNLYPQTQKDLIYRLMSGLDPNKLYQDAAWLFTTHSPYILSALNTLVLAYKIGNQDEESRRKVKEIIPESSWINPDNFSAYYVADGTATSIIDSGTGLISENELDGVSEVLADELDELFNLYRPEINA